MINFDTPIKITDKMSSVYNTSITIKNKQYIIIQSSDFVTFEMRINKTYNIIYKKT